MDSGKNLETKEKLSFEERELLDQLTQFGNGGTSFSPGLDIRQGLTSVLGEMGNAVHMLLHLLQRYPWSCPKSEQPTYNMLLQNIAEAANSGSEWVRKSNELDQSVLLALAPTPSVWIQ